jgi:secreted PhoX family phosphatase
MSNATAFTRFCSGSFAGREHGMDRPLFFTNEESETGHYDAAGSQTVVVADGKMYTVPDLGRLTRETTIVQPRRDALTVVLSSEDGPTGINTVSYVYMYVGTKQRRSNSVLDKNGLTNGKIYVLCGDAAQHNEGTFTSGSLATKWVEIPNAATLTEEALTIQADILGGFGFIRVEDIEFDPKQPTRSMFLATTGGSGPNRLGRLYELTMNPLNPIANGTLNVVYNSDTVSYSGAAVGRLTAPITGSLGTYTPGTIGTTDYPVSVDNIAVSKDFIVICEDRNSPADAVFANFARNGGVWTLNRNAAYAAKLQSTFNYAYVQTRDTSTGHIAGLWESSGVVTSDAIFGPGTFVINVQGHLGSGGTARMRSNIAKPAHLGGGTYTKAEAQAEFTEDGQLLIMRPVP